MVAPQPSKERSDVFSSDPNRPLVRAPVARIADQGESLLLLGADQSSCLLTGTSAELARAVLAFLVVPRSRAELTAHLEQLSGAPLEHPSVVEDLLTLLLAAGALQDASPATAEEPGPRSTGHRTRIVLGITGAIETAHAPMIVGALLEQGFDVEVAATKAALGLVSRRALEALSHRRVSSSVRGKDPSVPVPHIHLAEWAEVVLVYPATATTLSRIAGGDCSDLVAAVAISTRAPVLIAPSMNPAMYDAPAVQRNLDLLRRDGFWLIHPAAGVEVAQDPSARRFLWGAAPPPEAVIQILKGALKLSRDGKIAVKPAFTATEF
jgi:hypothetical protein